MMKKDINLLPQKYISQSQKKTNQRIRLMFVVLILLITAGSLYIPVYMVNYMKNKSITIDNKIISMKDVKNYREMYQQLQKDIGEREKCISLLESKQHLWSEILAQIWSKVPEGVSLLKIDYCDGGKMEIEGEALSYSEVVRFMVNIQNMNNIKEVDPINIVEKEVNLYGFVIRCNVEGGSGKDENK